MKVRLYPHQRESVEWMESRERKNVDGRGGILADEPGLGKSVSILAIILRSAGLRTINGGATAAERVVAAEAMWQSFCPQVPKLGCWPSKRFSSYQLRLILKGSPVQRCV